MDQNENTGYWIVTGAASGIGASVVRAVRTEGANVLALDVDEAKGSALAQETGALYRAFGCRRFWISGSNSPIT